MSIFKEFEKIAYVYHAIDSNSTKKTSYILNNASFSILMNIIRRNDDAIALLGQEISQYVANVNAKYTDAENIRKGDVIICESVKYKVVNKPKYLKIFNRYKVLLDSVE